MKKLLLPIACLLGLSAGSGTLLIAWYLLLKCANVLIKDVEISLAYGALLLVIAIIPVWLGLFRKERVFLRKPYICTFLLVIVVAGLGIAGMYLYLWMDLKRYKASPEYKKVVEFVSSRHKTSPPPFKAEITSWAASFFASPFGAGSPYIAVPAENDVRCWIVRNPLSRVNAHADKKTPSVWDEGIVAHEIAHCFDFASKVASVDDWTFVAPHLKKYVRSEEHATAREDYTKLLYGRKDQTLWMEIVADFHQAAYWLEVYPDEEARGYIAKYSEFRRKNAEGSQQDTEHNTSCWLDAIAGRTKPEPKADLFVWANRLRTSITEDTSLSCGKYLRELVPEQPKMGAPD